MTDRIFPSPELNDLLDLAIKAGLEIMEIYDTDFIVEQKADSSSVTEADRRAEAVILKGLARMYPGVPVVAEEEVAAGRVPDAKDDFFLVDPLDGTREFVSGNGEFTVNIARIRQGRPILGVIYAPVLRVAFAGAEGEGAYKAGVTDEGECALPSRLCVRPAPADGLVAVLSRSHGTADTQAWLARNPITRSVNIGSSLKFCLLADGSADLYPRLGRTMEWDTAAGDAILRAAGGLVLDLDGVALTYGKGSSADPAAYANPHFVAYADPILAPPHNAHGTRGL